MRKGEGCAYAGLVVLPYLNLNTKADRERTGRAGIIQMAEISDVLLRRGANLFAPPERVGLSLLKLSIAHCSTFQSLQLSPLSPSFMINGSSEMSESPPPPSLPFSPPRTLRLTVTTPHLRFRSPITVTHGSRICNAIANDSAKIAEELSSTSPCSSQHPTPLTCLRVCRRLRSPTQT